MFLSKKSFILYLHDIQNNEIDSDPENDMKGEDGDNVNSEEVVEAIADDCAGRKTVLEYRNCEIRVDKRCLF